MEKNEICVKCGKKESNVQVILRNGNLAFWCDRCIHLWASFCDICSRFCVDIMNDTHDGLACTTCFAQFIECNYCSVFFRTDNINTCEECDYEFCDDDLFSHDCEEEERNQEVNTSLILGENKAGSIIKIPRFVGLELEACGGKKKQLAIHSSCGMTHDGSLCSNGVEVQTPPRQRQDLENMIEGTTATMRDAGFVTDDGCSGLHVHIDFLDQRHNLAAIARLFRTTYAIEDIIYAYLNDRRSKSQYCHPLARNYDISDVKVKLAKKELIEKYYKQKGLSEFALAQTHNGFNRRYNGINLHSIFFRGTVEYRYHEGCLDTNEIIQWVNFLLHLTEYAIKKYDFRAIKRLNKMKNKKRKFQYMCTVLGLPEDLQKHMEAKINREHVQFFKKVPKVPKVPKVVQVGIVESPRRADAELNEIIDNMPF